MNTASKVDHQLVTPMANRKSSRPTRPPVIYGDESPPSSPLTDGGTLNNDFRSVAMSKVSVVKVKVGNDDDRVICMNLSESSASSSTLTFQSTDKQTSEPSMDSNSVQEMVVSKKPYENYTKKQLYGKWQSAKDLDFKH